MSQDDGHGKKNPLIIKVLFGLVIALVLIVVVSVFIPLIISQIGQGVNDTNQAMAYTNNALIMSRVQSTLFINALFGAIMPYILALVLGIGVFFLGREILKGFKKGDGHH